MGLDITYVVLSAGIGGGQRVFLEQATRLEQRGHNVRVYYMRDPPTWFNRPVPAVQFNDLISLKRALRLTRGIKVATWHETAYWVAESLAPEDRGYYLVQDIEESYYTNPRDAQYALRTYGLGLRPLASGMWAYQQLKSRFGLNPVLLRPAVDFETFYPCDVHQRDRTQILTQSRLGQGDDLKGWSTARATIEHCYGLDPTVSLVTFSIEAPQVFDPALPHTHVRNPSDQEIRQLYNRAGVYLLSSRHEGFGLTAAEAMACGCPVVATRCHGNEEFCRDGYTALTAEVGDWPTLARHCLALLRNPDYADDLGANAREFIQQYTWDRYIDRLEQEFLQRPRPVELRAGLPSRHEEATRLVPPRPVGIGARREYPNLHLDEEPTCDISIVIPTANNVDYVVECIRSCQQHSQGYEVEYVVVDDGTQDPKLLEAFAEQSRILGFRWLRNYQNLGFSATVNHGHAERPREVPDLD